MGKFALSVLNPEQKFFDYQATAQAVANNGSIFNITSGMAQGADASTRNGNSIKAASNLLNATMHWTAASSSSQRMRWMLLVDTNLDGVLPLVLDVLQVADINSPLNAGNAGRFTVLYDKTVLLDQYHPSHEIERFRKLSHHLKFSGGAGTAAQARDGNLFLLVISDSVASYPTFDFYNRFRYYDN